MNPHTPTGKVLRSFFLILVLLAVGSGGAGLLWLVRVEPPRHELTTPPPVVETTVARVDDVVERYIGYGSVRPIRAADVAAEVAARVVERVDDIRVGSRVSEGQPLFRLDDRQFKLSAERARSQAAAQRASLDELAADGRGLSELRGTAKQEVLVARNEKDRVTRLFERDLAAKKEHDFANLSYRQALRVVQEYERQTAKLPAQRARIEATMRGFEQEVALAELNVERCEIVAPFAGLIETFVAEVGDQVAPGTVVVTVVDDARVEVPIRLPAGAYDRALLGTPCRLTAENDSQAVWHGKVLRIDPVADADTRTFAVYIEVDNSEQEKRLVPGMFVRADVRGRVHADRILLPREICRNGRVFVVEDGVAKTRSIKTEGFLEDQAIVSGSLHTGDVVILSQLSRLVDGSPIRVRALRSAASKPEHGASASDSGGAP